MANLPFEYPWVSKLASPLPDINQNGCLEDESTTQIQTYLAQLGTERADLDEVIRQAEAIVTELKTARSKLDDLETLHKSFICASRRCPPEIIASIMLAYLELCLDESPNKYSAPLVFCAVSRQWKTIALSTPFLWTNIVLQSALSYSQAHIEVWLERSRGQLLNIFVNDPDYYEANPAPIDRLLGVSHRWRSFKFRISQESSSRIGSNADFPNLISLTMLGGSADPYNFPGFASAPRLSHVSIELPICPPAGWFNWENITRWSFDRISVGDFLQLLSFAHRLQEYHVQLLQGVGGDALQTRHLTRHSLQLLKVTCGSAEELIAFSQHLILPSLTTFHLSVTKLTTKPEQQGIPLEFGTFLGYCISKLEDFTFLHDLGPRDLIKLFPQMTSIKSLQVSCRSLKKPSLNDVFIQGLTNPSDSQGGLASATITAVDDRNVILVLPELERLVIRGVLEFTTPCLLEMVRSRGYQSGCLDEVRVAARLKDLRIEIDTPFWGLKPNDYRELEPLREEGLRVDVICRGKHMW